MNVTLKSALVALPLFVGYAFASAQTVLISDSFSTAGALNNSTPGTTVSISSVPSKWVALTGPSGATSNGSVLSLPTSTTQTDVLDLGANFFSANPAVYTLSLDVTMASGSGTGWLGFGFVVNPQTAGTLAGGGTGTGLNPLGGTVGASPFMLLRQNGQANVYRGSGTGTPLLTGTVGAFPGGSTYTLKLVLDTTQTAWTLDSFVGATQLDLNGASVGNTAVFASNPTDIRYIGFSTNGANFGPITLDNFILSVPSAVPEPATATLLAGAFILTGAATLRRRRPAPVSRA